MSSKENQDLSSDMVDCPMQVRIAAHPWEKNEIYKLRYQVYVEEMGKPLESILRKRKQIIDAMDDRSILIYVKAGSEIAATLRVTIASVEDYPADLVDTFQLHKFKTVHADPSNSYFGLVTKIAAKPHYRSSPAFYLMLVESYRLLSAQKVTFCFGGCNPSVVPLYERLGFRRFTKNFTDPGYGLLVPLVMMIQDIEHMKAIKSPIYRLARKHPSDLSMVQRFSETFPEVARYHNTQLVTQKSLWKYVESKLSPSPFTFPIFKNLDTEKIINLLLAGVIFSCAPGDCILHQDSLCNDLYILLSGTLVSSSNKDSHILQAGEHFGSLTFPDQSRQTNSIFALTECELFVLSRQSFERYQHLYQEASKTLLNNLKIAQPLSQDYLNTQQGGQNHE
ncbi:cyclic nucleotide-binding domain-containing protein [Sporomusa malonica]|uniref:Acetyltransferase (GNAT) domain-containing protein n=1 Tax=Sporomusa malonica TaxID=112901 RepID=A0A1W2E0S2_9FIRM|nr:cyclic nucleotide-binding domain-containing protein [Sporomusa malonica]SMD03339.1 Acetyltransferase (GNAT) domain-containing protein [Sporomusa malonica]